MALAAALLALAAAEAMAQVPGPPSTDVPPATGTEKAQPEAGEAPPSKVIPGRYIVKVNRAKDAKALAGEHGANPKHVFRNVLNGFSADLSAKQLDKLTRHPSVEAVEPVVEVAGDATQTASLPWGLDRTDQRYRPLSRSYTWGYSGYGVNAYVIDSGIQTSHPQFGGRASAVYDNVGDGRAGQDCNGHGTHVAGTLGGATYGVAKSVRLYSVRTLNCQNAGTSDGLIAAADWVRRYARRPAVVNISIGAPKRDLLNQAVTNLANSGIFVSVSAGNSGADACNSSPASAVGTFTTAASDVNDNRAYLSNWSSNWGPCVDGYAPGVNVVSAWPGSTTQVLGGTSMASPHVAGIIAIAKSAYGDGYTTGTWVNWLISNATTNVIGGNISGTPNRLVFKGTL